MNLNDADVLNLGAAALALLSPDQMFHALRAVLGREPSFEEVMNAHAYNRRLIEWAERERGANR